MKQDKSIDTQKKKTGCDSIFIVSYAVEAGIMHVRWKQRIHSERMRNWGWKKFAWSNKKYMEYVLRALEYNSNKLLIHRNNFVVPKFVTLKYRIKNIMYGKNKKQE